MVFSIAGFYPVYVILQLQARQEIKMRIKQGVPESEIHKIVFAVNEKINWVRKGKEFSFKNQLYDVVRKEYLKDHVIYYCINDKQEEKLFAGLDEMVRKQMADKDSSQGNTAESFSDLFSQIYVAVEPFRFAGMISSSKTFFDHQCTVISRHLETESQPPDLG